MANINNIPLTGGNYYYPVPCSQTCDYEVIVKSYGSGVDDDNYLVQSVQINAVSSVSINPTLITDFVELEYQLNLLGLGNFLVTPYEGDKTKITLPQTTNKVIGINTTLEGKPFYYEFKGCNCTENKPCDDTPRCNYYLYRTKVQKDGKNNDSFAVKGIKFASGTHNLTTAIPVNQTIEIARWLNGLTESEGKFEVIYDTNDILHLQIRQAKYTPIEVYFESTSGTAAGGMQTQQLVTEFAKSNCNKPCCNECGREGQVPCNNGQNDGCNNGLVARNGLCLSVCKPWTANLGGTIVPAGLLNQPVADCGEPCKEGLVATAAGCQKSNGTLRLCTLDFNITADPNEYVTAITICDFGTFTPKSPIILGPSGIDVLDYLNNETGICPIGQACFTKLPVEDAGNNLKKYGFRLTNVNLKCTGTGKPFAVTEEFKCAREYHTCIEPSNCHDTLVAMQCPIGSIFDLRHVKCVASELQCSDGTTDTAINANITQCAAYPFSAEQILLIRTKEQELKTSVSEVEKIENYAKKYGINSSGLYAAVAVSRLIGQGKLPDKSRYCLSTPKGTIKIEGM